MTLSTLMKKGGLREVAPAIPATAATDEGKKTGKVARVARVAVANPRHVEPNSHPTTMGWAADAIEDATKADFEKGRITAVLIDSPIVGPLWFAFADEFKPGDGIPVFFASELPFLRKMSQQELRRRYEEKLALGGGWIRDRIESTKH